LPAPAHRVPDYWQRATRELKLRDPVLKKLIASYSGRGLASRGDAFSTLARAIVSQQISVKAAESVWRKLGSCMGAISPEHVCLAGELALRQCGLSGRKALYLTELAQQFQCGALGSSFELDDEALIRMLTQLKGIGRWTAEMFLMFHLLRPNVFPIDDLGLRRAINLHYNRGAPLTVPELRALGDTWSPWRSVATWYLWRSMEPVAVKY
jgi:DNA-3-methyladenine glycosylase II